MRTLKTKILLVVLSSVIVAVLAIGITSFYNANQVIRKDSLQIMNLLSENKSENVNQILKRIRQSVDTLAHSAQEELEIVSDFKSQASIDLFSETFASMAINAATNTDEAISVYVRFDPTLFAGDSGFFITRDEEDNFNDALPTNLHHYAETDIEHVGWFYIPKQKGEPIWLEPYVNKNIDKKMISYVVPLFVHGEFLGVVGMDVDFASLTKIVANTHLYDTGYAFIVDGKANIVYHKELSENTNLIALNQGEFKTAAQQLIRQNDTNEQMIPYTYHGIRKEAAFSKLENGMRFIVTAPRSEIDEQANKMLIDMGFRSLIILILIALLCIWFTKRMVRPLQELTDVAKKIATGDLNVEIKHRSKDEVGVLADSFRLTIVHLSKYFKFTQELAYKDALTGIQNTRAYSERTNKINEKIKMGDAAFTIAIFDVNDLKRINDTYGHLQGDLSIVSAARLLCEVFDHYPIYRIGGDEFVVILEDTTSERCQQLLINFEQAVQIQNKHKRFSLTSDLWIARGCAKYQPEKDKSVNDVFKRADEMMYIHKKAIKMRK